VQPTGPPTHTPSSSFSLFFATLASHPCDVAAFNKQRRQGKLALFQKKTWRCPTKLLVTKYGPDAGTPRRTHQGKWKAKIALFPPRPRCCGLQQPETPGLPLFRKKTWLCLTKLLVTKCGPDAKQDTSRKREAKIPPLPPPP